MLRKDRCVCETQMLPIAANSKDGQGQKDKYLDTIVQRSCHKKYSYAIWNSNIDHFVMNNISFSKIC